MLLLAALLHLLVVLGAPVVHPRVTVTNTVVATFQATAQAGGSVTGTLRGVSPRSTSLRVQLLRGGTSEYDSPSIPITVS